jgi:hypothetical protein
MKRAHFKDLAPGQTFDFVGPAHNSFFLPCRKVSPRRYVAIDAHDGKKFTVGTIHAIVYRVDEYDPSGRPTHA